MTQSTFREYHGEFLPWSAVLTAIPMPFSNEPGEHRLLGRAKNTLRLPLTKFFGRVDCCLQSNHCFKERLVGSILGGILRN